MTHDSAPPVVGITCDLVDQFHRSHRAYASAVADAGGTPILLPCLPDKVDALCRCCDAFVFSGGDDPRMEHWDRATHAKASPIDEHRQAFELALLAALDRNLETPVLGICLGMQMMALHAGGDLEQHMPDSIPTAADHWGRKSHAIHGDLGSGEVLSHHRQAVTDPGTMRVVAHAHDGVVEAVSAGDRPFYLGVQWHPERTVAQQFGRDLFRQFVDAAREAKSTVSRTTAPAAVSD